MQELLGENDDDPKTKTCTSNI